jgi:cytochrome c oxidase subunit 3
LRGRWTKEHHFPLNGVGLYWHFVDGVWVILFTIFYIF